MYLDGTIENAILTKRIYGEDWTARFYCDSLVPATYTDQLTALGSQVVIKSPFRGSWEGLFWRFLPCSDPSVDVMISRDIDSRLNSREKAAVDEWMASDKEFHIMRDYYMHDVPILGGMWGAKRGAVPDMDSLIDFWTDFSRRGVDQDFLGTIIYPRVRDRSMIHDEVIGPNFGWAEPTRKKWPPHKPIEYGGFVGDYVRGKVLS